MDREVGAGRVLLAAVLVAGGLAARAAGGEGELGPRMQRIFESVRAVLPLAVDPEELGAERHRGRAAAISASAPSPCTRVGEITTGVHGERRPLTWRTSWSAAPSDEVTTAAAAPRCTRATRGRRTRG
jgi:hypothetical protein